MRETRTACTGLRYTAGARALLNIDIRLLVVSVYEGKKSYAGVITVTSNSCDVEDKIVGLIRTYKSSLTGASYSVRATVQAISTDPVHYKSGAPAAAPGFRYLNTTDNPDQKSERR